MFKGCLSGAPQKQTLRQGLGCLVYLGNEPRKQECREVRGHDLPVPLAALQEAA